MREALRGDWGKKFIDLTKRDMAITDQADEEVESIYEKASTLANGYRAAETTAREELHKAEAAYHETLINGILAVSPVDEDAAKKWFITTMVSLDSRTKNALKRRGYDLAQFEKDMTDFYRLTGGRLSRITFDLKGGNRAAASVKTGTVYVCGEFGKKTLWHE